MKTFDLSQQSEDWYQNMAKKLLNELSYTRKSSDDKTAIIQGIEKQNNPVKNENFDIRRTYTSKYCDDSEIENKRQNFEIDDLPPRMFREEFLEQRITRRNNRNSGDFSLPKRSRDEVAKVIKAGTVSVGNDRLPEELSEVYARDARRYDSAFERY